MVVLTNIIITNLGLESLKTRINQFAKEMFLVGGGNFKKLQEFYFLYAKANSENCFKIAMIEKSKNIFKFNRKY